MNASIMLFGITNIDASSYTVVCFNNLEMEKAGALNSEDEFTGFQLGDARRNLEQGELNKLFDRRKLSATSKLTVKSKYPEVRELFCDCIDQICGQSWNNNDGEPEANLVL